MEEMAPADPQALQALITLLDDHDMRAVDVFERLRAGIEAAFSPDDAQQLDARMGELAFDAVAARLRALMAPGAILAS